MNKKHDVLTRLRDSGKVNSILSSVLAILIGLLVGYLVLLILKPRYSLIGFGRILTGGFKTFGDVLWKMTPLLMTGLSVGFAYKTGLFNIGAPGQFLMGTTFALIAALVLKWPWYLCLLVALLAGAFWGFFPGLFKAFFNVNEVITSILLNWIALFLQNYIINLFAGTMVNSYTNMTNALALVNPSAELPKLGIDKLFNNNNLSMGILIAIAFAILAWFILNKTTFGFELKACGANKNAATYAGINAKRNIVLSMVIAGAFAGIAAGLYYLTGTVQLSLGETSALPAVGFNGIPVALLAYCDPIGIIFATFFIAFIQSGGETLDIYYSSQSVTVIISAIIYLSAFALIFKSTIARWLHGGPFLSTRKKKDATKDVKPDTVPPLEAPKDARPLDEASVETSEEKEARS